MRVSLLGLCVSLCSVRHVNVLIERCKLNEGVRDTCDAELIVMSYE